MQLGVSSQMFLSQRLGTGLLDGLRDGGARAIELWAAKWHVDYTDRAQMRELGAWFKGNDVAASLHAPLTADTMFSRHGSTPLNLVDADRGRRIAAMDEVKRAMEMAEHFTVRSCVVHLGDRENKWSERVLEFCLEAVEHLKAFAGPLGMQLLLENLRNEVATPEHLLEVLRVGHFTGCGVCLDVGHAHLSEAGLAGAFAALGERVMEVHVDDNGGKADDHLWPRCEGERPGWAAAGTIDWDACYGLIDGVDGVAMIEPMEVPGVSAEAVSRMLHETIGWWARRAERAQARTT